VLAAQPQRDCHDQSRTYDQARATFAGTGRDAQAGRGQIQPWAISSNSRDAFVKSAECL